MSLKSLNAEEARRLIEDGAVLIDIREPDEFARMHIPGALNVPVGRIKPGFLEAAKGRSVDPSGSGGGKPSVVIFHCQSGSRTEAHARQLAESLAEKGGVSGSEGPACESCILDGGLSAWDAAGLPVTRDSSQPLPIMRQVQIVAGGLVLAGVGLGYVLNPGFYLLAGFVGAGLVFAGISGWCGMARILMVMPWNVKR